MDASAEAIELSRSIEINGLRLHCFHGVFEQERRVGADYEVSCRIDYPFGDADSLDGTVNYARAIEVIKEVMARPVDLIETAAWTIRRSLLDVFPGITGGMIRVSKLHPPVPNTQLASVAAVIAW